MLLEQVESSFSGLDPQSQKVCYEDMGIYLQGGKRKLIMLDFTM